MKLYQYITDFLEKVLTGEEVEVYNEASVQYELAIYLRSVLGASAKVQLERNVDFFSLKKHSFLKKEMDIVVFSAIPPPPKHCIEVKFPRNGQYPEQMFAACRDVRFLEQLVAASFGPSYFLMLADDHNFWEGRTVSGIYSMFRGDEPIRGEVTKPTGSKDEVLHFADEYPVTWNDLRDGMKYLLIEVALVQSSSHGGL